MDLDTSQPYLVGADLEFTTGTELVPVVRFVWDVYGYYAALGVPINASKAMLRAGYVAHGGPESAELTQALSVLLGARADYDALTPELAIARYERKQARRKFRADLINAVMAEFGDRPDVGDLLAEHLRLFIDAQPDKLSDLTEEGAPTAPPRPDPAGSYRWGVENLATDKNLVAWRHQLITAANMRKLNLRLCVGTHDAAPDPWLVKQIGYRAVVFLRIGHRPTFTDAHNAITDIIYGLHTAIPATGIDQSHQHSRQHSIGEPRP